MSRPMCRHCHRRRINRGRRLCWSCWTNLNIRNLYPASDSKFSKRGIIDYNGASKIPAHATNTVPGTPERMDVLACRAARGESLFRDGDQEIDPHGFRCT